MDIPVAGFCGLIVGVMATVCVYPFILKRRADKLLAQCSTTATQVGDPLSQYLALLVYQLTAAYKRLEGKESDQAKIELCAILAGYFSFVKSKRHCFPSEQAALDAIGEACSMSETLRRSVTEQGNIDEKAVDQMAAELEKASANQPAHATGVPTPGR